MVRRGSDDAGEPRSLGLRWELQEVRALTGALAMPLPGLAGEQQDRLIKQWGLQPSELQIIPPSECSFDEADVLGSGERCAASAGYNTTLAPTPAFPLSGGHLSRGLQASEDAYRLLLKALEEKGPIF